jgi:hypothetical protein
MFVETFNITYRSSLIYWFSLNIGILGSAALCLEVTGLILGPETDYHDWEFLWFSLVILANAGIVS